MNTKPLITALILAGLCSIQAIANTADDEMRQALHAYHGASIRGQWHNPWMPAAAADAPAETVSADMVLTQIVAGYTRDVLDGSGWENPYLTNSTYSSGNTLLTVEVGSGVTTLTASTEPRREAPKIATLGIH